MSAYSDNFKRIDWSDFVPTPAKPREEPKGKAAYYMPDITPFRSPLSGRVLSSRKQVQHEERGYGVRQCGELRQPSDFRSHKPVEPNEKRLEAAFRVGLEKTGLA